MACFLAPAAEAAVVTVVKKRIEKKEKSQAKAVSEHMESQTVQSEKKTPVSKKLAGLMNLLWGGSFLLLIEHIWHGEVVPWPPFLTAMGSTEDAAEMLHEIATVGVTMAVLITFVWVAVATAVTVKESGNHKESVSEK